MIAESYRLHTKGLDLNGKPFPWYVAECGPEVEPLNECFHILWVPILVDAVLPPTTTRAATDLRDDEGGVR